MLFRCSPFFVRFPSPTADLEVYTLGIDKCPKSWVKDPHWSGHTTPGTTPSHEWSHPSILKPEAGQPDKIKLIDYLVINRNPRDKTLFKRNAESVAFERSASPMPPPAATSTRGPPSIAQLVVPSPKGSTRNLTKGAAGAGAFSAKNHTGNTLNIPSTLDISSGASRNSARK